MDFDVCDPAIADAVQWAGGLSNTNTDNTIISGADNLAPLSYTFGDSAPNNGSSAATTQLPIANCFAISQLMF